ncbi:MAG: Hsp20/alpha crystallin family protein [Anaerolineae bacterium]|nr:Hsp20/alpha crystallin family protein [Gemmatimonadaceae bacterium]
MSYRGSGLVPFGLNTIPFGTLRREIDRLFDDTASGRSTGSSWTPAVNIRESGREVSLDLELPGIKPESVDISVDAGTLTISGEKREERREGQEDGRYHLVERSYGSFTRSFTLPQGVDEEQILANFDNGILTISIPKAALPQPRKIQIGGIQREREVEATAAREPAKPKSDGARSDETGARRTGHNIKQ